MPDVRIPLRRVTGRSARLRWVYIVLGGALFMPYFLFSVWVVQVTNLAGRGNQLMPAVVAALGALPLVAITALAGPVRQLEVASARVLLGGRMTGLVSGPPASLGSRLRAGVWYLLHLAFGALLSGLSLAVPPMAALLLVLPAFGTLPRELRDYWPSGISTWWAPAAGTAELLALIAVLAAAGAAAVRVAPVLLGPTPAERLADAERRAADLAERGRLARELHDSVGHALSVVAIQASAADRDPDFVKLALRTISETAGAALADLDHMLGLLRDEPSGTAPQPTLADLGRLFDTARAAGLQVTADVSPDLTRVPAVASREAYRVVQEGLTNVLKHAGQVPVRVTVRHEDGRLTVEMRNPVPDKGQRTGSGRAGSGGGRGIGGICERAALLGGDASAVRVDQDWVMSVAIPL
jgi:signal transduction histidine kinase